MKKNYVNPSKHLGVLDKETFKNIEKLHQEYLDDALLDLNSCSSETEYLKALEIAVMVENDFADFYYKNRLPKNAGDKYLESLENAKKLLEKSPQRFINLVEIIKAKLSNVYMVLKQFDKAVNLNEYYFDYYNNLDNMDLKLKSQIIMISHVNLGKSYFDYSKFEEADKHFDEALSKMERNSQNSDLLLNVYLYKARINARNEKHDEANSLYQYIIDEAVNSHDKSLMKNRIIDIKNEYGDYLYKYKKYEEALEVFLSIEEEIKLNKNMTPQQSAFYSNVIYKIANIYKFINNLPKSNKYFKTSYELLSNNPAINKDTLIDYRTNIANVSIELKEYETAIKMLEENISYINNKNSLNSKEKAYLMQQYLRLSIVKERAKDIDGSFKSCLEAYNLVCELNKLEKDSFINTYLDLKNSLSNFYFTKNELGKSEKLSLELLDEANLRKGPATDEFAATIHERLIKIYTSSNYTDGLIEHYEALKVIYKGLNYPQKYISTLEHYAYVLLKESRHQEAIKMLEEIIDYAKKMINEEEEINNIYGITTRKICSWVRDAYEKKMLLDKEYNLDELYLKCEGYYKNLMKINSEKYYYPFTQMYTEIEKYYKYQNRSAIENIQNYQKAIQVLEDYPIKNKDYYSVYTSIIERIAVYYSLAGDINSAIEHAKKSLEIHRRINVDEAENVKIGKLTKFIEELEKKSNNF